MKHRQTTTAGADLPAAGYLLEFAGVEVFCVEEDWMPFSTERPVLRRATKTVNEMEVSAKTIAAHAVIFVNRLSVPHGPNAVCEPCPPKAPARSAPLPGCSRMMPIRTKQTMICKIVKK